MLDDIKKTLWATADKLRANMDAAEYKHLVLGLIFVKYISDSFSAKRAELAGRFADPADEYFLPDSTHTLLACELEDRDYYREVNVFWVPEAARWEALRATAKQPDIGKHIDDVLSLIEAENPKLKGILDKRFARAQLPDGKLGELVDLVSIIGFGSSAAEARDVLGAWLNQRVCVFAPKADVPAAFLRSTIEPQLAHIEATETATTVIHLGKGDIDRFAALVPSSGVMAAFAVVADPLYSRIVANKQTARTLATLRDTLLPRLISGQLRLPEAEAIFEPH